MAHDQLMVQVALPLPSDKLYTYSVPPVFRNRIHTGSFVLVPVKNRKMVGYVLGFSREKPVSRISPVTDVLFDRPMISDSTLRLVLWMSEYYLSSIGVVLESVLPPFAKYQENKLLQAEQITPAQKRSLDQPGMHRARQLFSLVEENPLISVKKIKKEIGHEWIYYTIRQLERIGFIKSAVLSSRKVAQRGTEDWVILKHTDGRLSAQRVKIIEFLRRHGGKCPRRMIVSTFTGAAGILARMRKQGMIEVEGVEKLRKYEDIAAFRSHVPVMLNDEQKTATETIEKALMKDTFSSFLLFGVTGSGKTQVYIELIDRVIKAGRSALYLVPEIFMSSQVISRFRFHFGDLVGVLHSRMTISERFDTWNQIIKGAVRIVIGPRSAVFAPASDLGIIIVDEEHDHAYKQEEAPYYNARDVALYRGRIEKIPVVLGSATPSLESFFNVRSKKMNLVTLNKRVDEKPLPEIAVIDMKDEWKKGKSRESKIFSEYLLERMRYYLSRGEQVLIFQNRRGYSSFIQCGDCGFVDQCPSCSITLTYHKDRNVMNCHYCGFTKKGFSVCPGCSSTKLMFHGIGTQWLEEELETLFPERKKLRIDADSLSRKGMHRKFSRQIEEGDAQILFGTQILAKGWDLPNLNLVGIVNADTGLFMPDFRSFERSFQLLTQVSGRAGRRDSRGEVVVQTYMPENYALGAAREHDFISFYERETPARAELSYPPYGRLILMSFDGEDKENVEQTARLCGEIGRKKWHAGWMLGPADAPIGKIKDRYRMQAVFRSSKKDDPNGSILREKVKEIINELETAGAGKKVMIRVNADPYNIM